MHRKFLSFSGPRLLSFSRDTVLGTSLYLCYPVKASQEKVNYFGDLFPLIDASLNSLPMSTEHVVSLNVESIC